MFGCRVKTVFLEWVHTLRRNKSIRECDCIGGLLVFKSLIAISRDLINAGKETITLVPGASIFGAYD